MAYVFIEFPKWVTPSGGVPVIVKNAEQEAAVMVPPVSPRDALVHEASALGIKVDGRWSLDRLKSEIAAQQQEPT